MVIQIRLSDRIDHTQDQIETDSLNRAWCGYDPGVSDEVLWEHNRGRWDLKEDRIADETYATFVHDGRIVAVYRIEDHERVSDPGPKVTKVALIGRPLEAADPVRLALVGKPATHRGRNAINYVADDLIDDDSRTDAGRRAFLLTWNPDNWEWAGFEEGVVATAADREVREEWSTGGRKRGIHRGDLVFLLRQGKRGRGIVGSGRAAGSSEIAGPDDEIIYQGPHWDGSGNPANYVDVLWDRLLERDELLPTEVLTEEFPDQDWSPMASGTQIRPDVVDALEARWSSHLQELQSRPTRGQGYVVNAVRRKAIEDAAQDWLMQHYEAEGWSVRDTRYNGPYDALATKGYRTLYLEAKGTQSSGEAVFLTRGEVEHARLRRGDCIIGIWSGMRFTESGEIDPDAGETIIMPFEPDIGTLSALQYRWR